jgi:hypothetical protein
MYMTNFLEMLVMKRVFCLDSARNRCQAVIVRTVAGSRMADMDSATARCYAHNDREKAIETSNIYYMIPVWLLAENC